MSTTTKIEPRRFNRGAQRRCSGLRHLIGGTPLLAITCRVGTEQRTVYAKLESLNFTGSIKDRMALRILEEATASGELREGDTLVEATSGNTGIALAAIGCALGHPVKIYMPDWMSQERTSLIRGLGAEVVPVSAEEGGFSASVTKAREFAHQHPDAFLAQQFDNAANVRAHSTSTGPEILSQLQSLGRRPSAFVAGVGTGGTVMGVGGYLRSVQPSIRIHPLEPANSPTLRLGRKAGSHRIQGISDEFIPSIVQLDQLDEIVDVWDGDAILMAQRIATELGFGVGISSGANLLGALQVALGQGPDSTVVTVFPDSNKKYLSTDLCRTEPEEERYLCGSVDLLDVHIVGGVRVIEEPSRGTPPDRSE